MNDGANSDIFKIRDSTAGADRFWISSAGVASFGGIVNLGNNSRLSDATTSSVSLNSSSDVLLTAVQSGAVFAVKTWNGSTQAERFKISGAGATATTAITGNATVSGTGTFSGTVQLNTSSYEGSLTFGSNATWRCGIRQHDDGHAELRIWAKNTAGKIFLATGYDGEPASIAKPTAGLVVANNNVGIGNWSSSNPSSILHIKTSANHNYEFEEVAGELMAFCFKRCKVS